jgi:tellurite resistance protein TerC
VLFWGVLSALALRLVFILAGVALIERFHWLTYAFGGLLVATSVKMVWAKDRQIDPERNLAVRLFRRWVPMTEGFVGDRFVVRRDGRWLATPLLLVLLLVELTDVVFAVDSIPAILAVTQDPFIVYTSNALAILGLRSLYFALAGLLGMFHYLHYGLAATLAFVGGKMLLTDVYKLPVQVSLGVVAGILAVCVLASLVREARLSARSAAAET